MWTPPADVRETTQLGRYLEWLRETRGIDHAGYDELWRWSVDDLEGFWGSLWEFFEIRAHTPYERVLGSREMPGAEWFTGSRLNYAEHMLGRDEDTGQVEPKLMLAIAGYRYGEKPIDRRAEVAEIRQALPSLERVVHVPYTGGAD